MPRRALAALLALAFAGCGSDPAQRCGSSGGGALVACSSTIGTAPGLIAGGARQLIRPDALGTGSAEIAVAEGERVALFIVNAGGRDGATASLVTANVAAPASPVVRQAMTAAISVRSTAPGDAGVLEATRPAGALLQRLRSGATEAAMTAAATPAHTSFCVLSSASYDASSRRSASLAVETEHALVYVDDDRGDVSPDDATQLADAFERRILPPLTRLLGTPSDVDGNGKVILFVTPLPGLWGYYWANDVLLARDGTADCTGTRSNAADAIYVAPPAAVTAAGFTPAEAVSEVLPGIIAHEFSHLLSYNRRCLARTCLGAEETWIEEGIAKVAEDEAGYGWNVTRGDALDYLTRTHEDLCRGYDGRSVTRWEGDRVGNYEGAHAFFRFYADRLGADLLASLTSGATGTRNVERALGMSLPEAIADLATALMFSNSAAAPSPDFSFSGAGWTPLHEKLRALDAAPLGPGGATASLRPDGWNAFVTGPAGSGGGTVRVASTEAVKPWVAVVRFRGEP